MGGQVGGVLGSRPCPPGVDHLVRGPCEQVRRDPQGSHPLQLVDLAQEGLQAKLRRVSLDLGQQLRATDARGGVGSRQRFQPLSHLDGQTGHRALAERRGGHRPGAGHDALHPARGSIRSARQRASSASTKTRSAVSVGATSMPSQAVSLVSSPLVASRNPKALRIWAPRYLIARALLYSARHVARHGSEA